MNVLWSYYFAREQDLLGEMATWQCDSVRFFADSGAYTARTLGVHLDTDSYGAWLVEHEPHLTVYANLDVGGAPRVTWENQKRLEDMGLSPMPVFHTGEKWSWLDRYLTEGYTYIALGKLVGAPWSVLRRWLDQAFKMAEGKAVFHGFGLTALRAIRDYPFFSVDSTSWSMIYRMGMVRLFDERRGRWVVFQVGKLDKAREHADMVRHYGIPMSAISREGVTRSRATLGTASARSYLRCEDWVRRRHGALALPPGRGYPTTPRHDGVMEAGDADGFHIYLAEVVSEHHRYHAAAKGHLTLDDVKAVRV